jgi:hypothetical protein
VDWIHVAQDRNQWQALVNMVMNLWVPLQEFLNYSVFLRKTLLCRVSFLDTASDITSCVL